ncbi:lipoprotein [Novosphingobium barchaimii]|nr:lipoprotein [Novosphingobium barchaimii]
MASYYGHELAGNRTASGERFNPADLTAAHRTLPLGSKVRVTNPRTGDSVIVRINDRGPFHGNRLIDLSEAAAREIGIRAAGSGKVELAVEAD